MAEAIRFAVEDSAFVAYSAHGIWPPCDLCPDNRYGFGRISHGYDVNDGLEIATI